MPLIYTDLAVVVVKKEENHSPYEPQG